MLEALASTVSRVSAPPRLSDASVDLSVCAFACLSVCLCEPPFLFILFSSLLQDPTAYPYQFQDDPYLSPRTSAEFVRLKHANLYTDIKLLS